MRLRTVPLLALLASSAAAQSGATVHGTVYDSIARAPLAGATVQLVARDAVSGFSGSAISDSLGHYTIPNVPNGQFTIGFFHAVVDSLGVQPPLHAVQVDGAPMVRADLAIPSPGRLRTAICGAPDGKDSVGVVIGTVHDARDGSPASGVRVTGLWAEVSFTKQGIVRRAPRLDATTGENGWFALCNVPSAGLMALVAMRGGDTTDLVDILVPASGFLRRELFLGDARTLVTIDSAPVADGHAPVRRVKHVGEGRLTGTVVTTVGGQAIAGARVGIPQGPETRANERGEWALTNVPGGTRVVDIRAVGYYPERRQVNVVADVAPVRVSMMTLKSVLDTMHVHAQRVTRDFQGFEERRRSTAGRFVTAAQLSRQLLINTSDAFKNMPGVRMEFVNDAVERRFKMRGPSGECIPAIWVNGQYFDQLSPDDLDLWMDPREIVGIEIYSETTVPPQYRRMTTRVDDLGTRDVDACGSILFWSKRR